ncbi:MAG: hypothetical protein ACM3O9_08135 [Methylocystaceae bacterium]
MTSDQQLHDRACGFVHALLGETENFDETLRYMFFLREAIDQYMLSLEEENDDDYPCLQ